MAAVLPCTVQATRRQAFLSLYSPSQIFALSLTSRRSSPPASTSSLLLSSAAALPAAFPSFRLPRLASLVPESTLEGLRELLPPWVLAVPKSKTTHSAKKMRSANKGLKEKHNLVSCPSCGTPKMAHHLCHECHVAFRKEYHAEAKERKAIEQL